MWSSKKDGKIQIVSKFCIPIAVVNKYNKHEGIFMRNAL